MREYGTTYKMSEYSTTYRMRGVGWHDLKDEGVDYGMTYRMRGVGVA